MAALRTLPFDASTALVIVIAVVTFLGVHSTLISTTSDLSGISAIDLYPKSTLSDDTCKGTIAECSVAVDAREDDEMEFTMDSETNSHVVASTWYISYGALWRNVIPCSKRGVSYYSCHIGTQVNPYTRGCSRITRCRD